LVFTASSFKQVQQFDFNKINKLHVPKIRFLLKYAANSGSRVKQGAGSLPVGLPGGRNGGFAFT
jgi:hypothetical protein